MTLFLVRHGEAESTPFNSEKSLTQNGKVGVEATAAKLRGIPIHRIAHSGLLRARQTAELLQKNLAPDVIIEELPFLKPESMIDEALMEIEGETEPFMIVSHLPFLPKLLGKLVANDEDAVLVPFYPATAVLLQKRGGAWTIQG